MKTIEAKPMRTRKPLTQKWQPIGYLCVICGERDGKYVYVAPKTRVGLGVEVPVCKQCRTANTPEGETWVRFDMAAINAVLDKRRADYKAKEDADREERSRLDRERWEREWAAKPENEKLASRIAGLEYTHGNLEKVFAKLDAEKLRTIICWLGEQGIEIKND